MDGSLQSWLLVLAPYFAVLVPILMSARNSRKLDRVQAGDR